MRLTRDFEKATAKLDLNYWTGLHIELRRLEVRLKDMRQLVTDAKRWIAEIRNKEKATGFEFYRLYRTVRDVGELCTWISEPGGTRNPKIYDDPELMPNFGTLVMNSFLLMGLDNTVLRHLRAEHLEIISCRSQGRPGAR